MSRMNQLADRHLGLDRIEKADEFLMPMVLHAAADDLAVEHVEGGEQGGGAVMLVVVGDALDVADPHGKQGLGAFEGLDLALLINAKHHSHARRIEIKPDARRAASRRRRVAICRKSGSRESSPAASSGQNPTLRRFVARPLRRAFPTVD